MYSSSKCFCAAFTTFVVSWNQHMAWVLNFNHVLTSMWLWQIGYLSPLSYFLIARKVYWQSVTLKISPAKVRPPACQKQKSVSNTLKAFTVITVSDTALIFWAETCNTLQLIPTSVLFNPTRPWLKHSHWHEWEIDLKTMPANGSWWLMGDCLID